MFKSGFGLYCDVGAQDVLIGTQCKLSLFFIALSFFLERQWEHMKHDIAVSN